MKEKIFDFVRQLATGEKRRPFFAIVIILFIVLMIVFPYVDANFLYFSRIEKRLDNLGKLVEISGYSINDAPELLDEYQSILSEVSSAREKNIIGGLSKADTHGTDYWTKFIGGGFLFALVGIIGLFSKNKGLKMTCSLFLKNNFTIFILCSVMAAIFAFIFAHIPTLGAAWLNAILSPVIQLILVYLLLQPPKNQSGQ